MNYKVGDYIIWTKSAAKGEVCQVTSIYGNRIYISPGKHWNHEVFISYHTIDYIRKATKLEVVLL